MRIVTLEYVYSHLICEFDHWDICLKGLVCCDSCLWYCEVADPNVNPVAYVLYKVEWNDACEEYLTDYKAAYKHWFYSNGQREHRYDGWDLSWFARKWGHKNPIESQAKHCPVDVASNNAEGE